MKTGKLSTYFENHPGIVGLITWICRILVGATFVYSGFAKGIDPWGSLYKFEEYFALFGFNPGNSLIIAEVFFLCIYEFFCGVSLLTGSFRRSSVILTALMMVVMLPLTFWIMISDPVSDCGCFGDAVIISNSATFWKNVVICVLIGWLWKFNKRVACLINPYLQWIQATCSALFIIVVGGIGYVYQPLIDFRPYHTGSKIIEFDDNNEDDAVYAFVYRRGNEIKMFAEDEEVPDEGDGWEFVERIEVADKKVNDKKIGERNLTVWNPEDDEDVTHEVITDHGKMIILFMPSVKDVSIASTWIINSLKDMSERHAIDFIAIVSGSQKDIEEWQDLSLADYPIYTADDTQIKEVVRGNPGVVYLSDGVIEWKSTLRALPASDFMAAGTPSDPQSFSRDNNKILRNIALIYVAVLSVLIALSFSGRFVMRLTGKSERRKMEK